MEPSFARSGSNMMKSEGEKVVVVSNDNVLPRPALMKIATTCTDVPFIVETKEEFEAGAMQNISWTSNIHIPMPHGMFGPQGWADLPDGILRSIIVLLGSTRDILAFIATCPSWYNTFLSIKSTLGMLFPPVIFRNCADQTSSADSNIGNTWELIDPAYPSTPLRLLSPPSTLDKISSVKCSYGHAIFSSGRFLVIMDVLTGTTVAAPPCPSTQLCYRTFISSEKSPDSYLFVSGPNCLYAWRVGRPSWLHCDFVNAHSIKEMVAFKGRFIAKIGHKLYTVHLAPHFHVEALRVACSEYMDPYTLSGNLVACEDTLLLLGCNGEAYSIDFSTQPAKYMRVADGSLKKCAFFFGHKRIGQPRHLVNPDRVGLKGGHVYQLDENARVFSYPVDGFQNEEQEPEPCFATINARLARNPTSFAAWV